MEPKCVTNSGNQIVTEGTTVLMKLIVKGVPNPSATWYKYGNVLESPRIKVEESSKIKELKIIDVTEEDTGLYTVILKNNFGEETVTVRLDVVSKERYLATDFIYYYLNPKKPLYICKHLNGIKARQGQQIDLKIEFKKRNNCDFKWYKNGREIVKDNNIKLLLEDKCAICTILFTTIKDSGEYTLVAYNEYGIASSFTDVTISDLCATNQPPKFKKILPSMLDACEDEDVALNLEVDAASDYDVVWFKNNKKVVDCDVSSYQNYGSNRIGLCIPKVYKTASGFYKCIIKNDFGSAESNCMLSVHSAENILIQVPTRHTIYAKAYKELETVAACIGSSVSFVCCIDTGNNIDNIEYKWTVGSYTVEADNENFQLEHVGHEYKLRILGVQRDMAGKITCKIRSKVINNTTIRAQSTGFLDVIPYNALINATSKLTPASPWISVQKSKFYVDCGMTMRVNFGGVPRPDITWFKDNINIVPANNAEWKRYKLKLYSDHCIMTISDVCNEDVGVYRILIQNRLGSAEDVIIINTDSVCPTPKESPHGEIKQDDKGFTVILSWPQSENKRRVIYEVEMEINKNVVEVVTVSDLNCVFNNVAVGTCLNFRYRTKNKYGISNYSPSLELFIDKITIQPIVTFVEQYRKTVDVLGSGTFGEVTLVKDKNGKCFAAKEIYTNTKKKKDTALREFNVLKRLSHEKLIKLHGAFQEEERFIIVSEYLSGGELFERVVEEENVTEADCIQYVRQICEGVNYMHKQKVVHLDLKAENIMCVNKTSNLLKIIDFGLARILKDDVPFRTLYGTKDYVAPEVLTYEPISLKTDMWSVGVVTYVLLSGLIPFLGDTWREKSVNITKVNYHYDSESFYAISELAKNFIDKLLVMPPEKRMTAAEALNHMWLIYEPKRRDSMKKTQINLRTYLSHTKSMWQRAGNVLRAAHRLRNLPTLEEALQ